MGDRSNIKIKQNDGKSALWFYSHWCGAGLAPALATALRKAEPRWGDESYATRILVQSLLEECGAESDNECGFGLSTYMCDNEHDILEVDFNLRRVKLLAGSSTKTRQAWTFDEYLAGANELAEAQM